MAIEAIGSSVALQQGLAHRDLSIVALRAQKQAAQGIIAVILQAANAAAGKPAGNLDLSV